MIASFLFIIFFIFAEKIQSFLYFPGAYINTLGKDDSYNEKLPDSWEKIYFDVEKQEVFWVYIENDADETIYFFHGNGGDLRYYKDAITLFWDWGYNVLALEYPWYGKLEGIPTRENILISAKKLYILAKEKYRLEDEKVFVWGYSIGSGIATEFATEYGFEALILEAPYTSWYDLTEERLGFIPQKFLGLEDDFNTEEALQTYSGAVLLVHGKQDDVISHENTQKLEESGGENIYAIIDEDGDHYNLLKNSENNSKIEYFLEKKEFQEDMFRQEKIVEDLDFETDSSFTKYVDPDISYNELWYIPTDMRDLNDEYIIDRKWDAQLRWEAAKYFELLSQTFYRKFWEKVIVVSTYRSYGYQAGIKARWCPDHLCAKAWHSEHQSWLGIDVWETTSKADWEKNQKLSSYYLWLSQNAHKYGYHNPYRNGLEIDGYDVEPWHWRYLWRDFASYLYRKNITFAEYYKEKKSL